MNALETLADELVAKAGPKLAAAVLAEVRTQLRYQDDPLMTVKQASAHTGLSTQKLYDLINAGVIKKAPGMTEIRVRRSNLDAYGK